MSTGFGNYKVGYHHTAITLTAPLAGLVLIALFVSGVIENRFANDLSIRYKSFHSKTVLVE